MPKAIDSIITDPFYAYSENNIASYFQGPTQYYRVDYQWHLKNTGQNSNLYISSSGTLYSSDPGGNIDIGYESASLAGLLPINVNQIKLGIIDSGINLTHPDFEGITFTGRDYSGGTDISDTSGHGTCIGGIIFARQNGTGTQGIVKNLSSAFIAKVQFRGIPEVANAIHYCIDNNVKIINLSWGTPIDDPDLKIACLRAQQNGVVIVCAAPNVNQNIDITPDYPASWKLDNIIVVTSITRTGIKYSPAAYGATTVHIGAPGRVIVTTALKLLQTL